MEKVKKDKGKLKTQEGTNDGDQVEKKAEPKAKGKAKAKAQGKRKAKAKAKAKVSKGNEEPASPVIQPKVNPPTPHQSPEDIEMEHARNEISMKAACPDGFNEPQSPLAKRKLFDSDQEGEAESVTAQPSETKPGRKKRAAAKRKASALETGGSKGSPPLKRKSRAKALAKVKASPKAAPAPETAEEAPDMEASASDPAAPALETVPKAKAKARAKAGAKAGAKAAAKAGSKPRRPRLAPAPEMLDDDMRDLMYKDMVHVRNLDFEELKGYAKSQAKKVEYKNSMLNIYWSKCSAGVKYQGGPEVAYFAFNLNMLGTTTKGPFNERMMCAVNGAKLMVTKLISNIFFKFSDIVSPYPL